MNEQIFCVIVRCKCGALNATMIPMPLALDPMDSDNPVVEGVMPCGCDCGRTATVRMTLEATPNEAWANEEE